MPGYGVLAPGEGTGLLSWPDAQQRLAGSHDYWLATTWPDGRPHVMPVWGVWDQAGLWFSSGGRSRKIANLSQDPRCVVTTDDALDPVILEGVAEVIGNPDGIRRFLDLLNAKYKTEYGLDFLDPAVNATVRISPRTAFALLQTDFTGSPTRWTFATRHPDGALSTCGIPARRPTPTPSTSKWTQGRSQRGTSDRSTSKWMAPAGRLMRSRKHATEKGSYVAARAIAVAHATADV